MTYTPNREEFEAACVSHQRLLELLSYDPETGIFVWLKTNTNIVPAGTTASIGLNADGYRFLKIDKKSYSQGRLAWFYVHGKWPIGVIDHMNGVRSDNRLSNLRDVSISYNTHNSKKVHRNNKLGILGVNKRPTGRYQASITVGKKKKFLGTFETAHEAGEAYLKAKAELHGGFLP